LRIADFSIPLRAGTPAEEPFLIGCLLQGSHDKQPYDRFGRKVAECGLTALEQYAVIDVCSGELPPVDIRSYFIHNVPI
jgi:hypothetical protein